jgi:hypothetical protein
MRDTPSVYFSKKIIINRQYLVPIGILFYFFEMADDGAKA